MSILISSLRQDTSKDNEFAKGLSAHTAASSGDLDALIAIAVENPEALKYKDNNGWNPVSKIFAIQKLFLLQST